MTATLSRSVRVGIAALLVAVAFLIASGQRAQAGQRAHISSSCLTTLPLSYSLKSNYAASYHKTLTLYVRSTGAQITGMSVSLTTFKGVVLGKADLKKPLTTSGTFVTLKLAYPMQAGTYTLYFQGFPNTNPSCGPKHNSDVLTLTTCQAGGLPVDIVSPREGRAASYGGTYSFDLKSTDGTLLNNLVAKLTTRGGRIVGQKKISVLFGELAVHLPLRDALQPLPTQYTLSVSGFAPGRPRSCGASHVSDALTFS